MSQKKTRFVFSSIIFALTIGLVMIFWGSSEEGLDFRKFIGKKEQSITPSHFPEDIPLKESVPTRSIASISGDQRSGGRVNTNPPFRPGLRAKRPESRNSGSVNGPVDEFLGLIEGREFEMDGRDYVLLKDVYGIKDEDFDPASQELKKQLVGLKIVLSAQTPLTQYQSIVLNTDSNNLVVFTGKLKIKLFKPDQVAGLISRVTNEFGYDGEVPSLDYKLEHIRVVYFVFENYEDTMSFYEIVKTSEFDDLVERVNIDLIEWQRTE